MIFSPEERQTIARFYAKFKEVFDNTSREPDRNQRVNDLLLELTSLINEASTIPKTVAQVRTAIKNIKSSAKTKVMAIANAPRKTRSDKRKPTTPSAATPATPGLQRQEQDEAEVSPSKSALEREVLLLQRDTYLKLNDMVSEARLAIFEHRLSLRGVDVSEYEVQMPPGVREPSQE